MNWLEMGELEYLKEDNEWHLVLLDIADLMQSYANCQNTSDPKEYAARAIGFVRNHIERESVAPTYKEKI